MKIPQTGTLLLTHQALGGTDNFIPLSIPRAAHRPLAQVHCAGD